MGNPPLHNLYGPTEASIGTVWWRCNPQHERKAVPIGRPISNTQAYTLDRYLQPVPIGVPGELHLAGVCLTRGYLNHSDLTACSFIPNPFSSDLGTRLYKTGDVVRYLPDGNIEFLGRIDDQVKIHGQRIEMNEIEAALAEHPDVLETVVTVQEQVAGEKRLVAYVVLDTDKHLSISELRRFLSKKLPEYMVPSAFVLLDALPLTPIGKVDRRALPPPDKSRPHLQSALVPPRTQVEDALAGIWAEVLGLAQVGINDNFFELGGNSLQAVQLASKISGLMNLDVSVRYIFLNPSIARLADALENLPSVETVVTRMNKVD